jgi:Zn-dependent protease with chaperone function
MTDTDWTKKIWNEANPSPKHEVVCRHCHVRNRVIVARAAIEPEKFICAQCKEPLFLTPDEPLVSLSSRSFEHPLDASTLRTLRAIPGVSILFKAFYKQLNERALLYNLSANAIHCSEEQFPELKNIVQRASDRLDSRLNLNIFFTSAPYSNAFTSGGSEAILCFSTALLNHLTDDELLFVTGHEIGHLLSEHTISRLLLKVLLSGGLTALPEIARYLSFPIQLALLKWSRCSELTADRAGLLACRNVTTALNCMMKMAAGNDPGVTSRTELSLAAFVEQAYNLKTQDSKMLDSIVASLFTRQQTHPLIAWRILELLDWVENGNYFDILSGKYI